MKSPIPTTTTTTTTKQQQQQQQSSNHHDGALLLITKSSSTSSTATTTAIETPPPQSQRQQEHVNKEEEQVIENNISHDDQEDNQNNSNSKTVVVVVDTSKERGEGEDAVPVGEESVAPQQQQQRACLYWSVFSCLQGQEKFSSTTKKTSMTTTMPQTFTLAELDLAVDDCVQNWKNNNNNNNNSTNSNSSSGSSPVVTIDYSSIATEQEKENKNHNFPFQVLDRGALKDRVDWSVFRLGLVEEVGIKSLHQGCSSSSSSKKNDEDDNPRKSLENIIDLQALLKIPEWWHSAKNLPKITRPYLTGKAEVEAEAEDGGGGGRGGSYLPPFYDEPDTANHLSNGFFLPKGPVRLQNSSLAIGNFYARIFQEIPELRPNLGDCYNNYVISLLSGTHINKIQQSGGSKILCAIGSIAYEDCDVVWGAGQNQPLSAINPKQEIYAMRGPNTRANFAPPPPSRPTNVYGDPGLLLPLFHPMQNTNDDSKNDKDKVDLCIIPHYIDQNETSIQHAIQSQKRSTQRDTDAEGKEDSAKNICIRVLNIKTCDLHNYVLHMKGCKRIVASSLHGLIFGLAYGIPGIRIILSQRVTGGHFKFKDFYHGIGHPELYIYQELINVTQLPLENLISLFDQNNLTTTVPMPAINVEDLWNVNPIHAEALGVSRQDHVEFAQSYTQNLEEQYAHGPYKELE